MENSEVRVFMLQIYFLVRYTNLEKKKIMCEIMLASHEIKLIGKWLLIFCFELSCCVGKSSNRKQDIYIYNRIEQLPP